MTRKLRKRYHNEPPLEHVPDDIPADAAKIEFAKRLSAALTKKGWTQSELGRRSGAPRDSISVYIAGRALPGPERLAALAKALGVEASWLIPTRGVRTASERVTALETRDLGDGSVWLRVNQKVEWPAALKIMQILKGEDEK